MEWCEEMDINLAVLNFGLLSTKQSHERHKVCLAQLDPQQVPCAILKAFSLVYSFWTLPRSYSSLFLSPFLFLTPALYISLKDGTNEGLMVGHSRCLWIFSCLLTIHMSPVELLTEEIKKWEREKDRVLHSFRKSLLRYFATKTSLNVCQTASLQFKNVQKQ